MCHHSPAAPLPSAKNHFFFTILLTVKTDRTVVSDVAFYIHNQDFSHFQLYVEDQLRISVTVGRDCPNTKTKQNQMKKHNIDKKQSKNENKSNLNVFYPLIL